jgi:phosphohistidine swiveling domain-containing protein
LLSHAAVIGREYGIPAVLNVPGATQILRTGQQVEIDGSAGTVRILEAVADDAA